MKDIIIIHENSAWVEPLVESFKKLDVKPIEWFLDEGEVCFDKLPPDAVFYNRMSASSHTRGHRYAPELTHVVLNWLEKSGRLVINGTQALYLELSKIAQYAELQKAGIKTPETVAVVGVDHLLPSAEKFGYPLILKPNRGGKGLGVQLFRDAESLQTFLQSESLEHPLDGIWLLQRYIQPPQAYITRCEFVGAKFLYAVNVETSGGFELCPADVCQVGERFCPATKDNNSPHNIFSITDMMDEDPFIQQAEIFLKNNQIGVAGIEVIRDNNGQLWAYDVNTNTNYNALAEQTAKVKLTGMDAIAQCLFELSQNS